MKYVYKIATVTLIAAASAMAQTPPAKTGPAAKSYSAEYGVIVQKNIFLKDRRSSNSSRQQSSTPPPPPVPVEKTYTLIGVVVGDQNSRAYFDHAGNVEHHSVGDVLGHGKIIGIEVGGIRYELQEKQTLVRVGQDLTGAISAARDSTIRPVIVSPPVAAPSSPATATPGTPAQANPATAAAGTSPGAAEAGDTAGLSIEERMRRRRQQATDN